MTAPFVTVCIPSHRPAMVGAAMGSVIDQTADGVQLLVSFSKDYWATKFNELVAAASGQYIALLCDDDLLHHDFVAKTLLVAAAGADIVYTDYARVRPDGEFLWSALPWTLASFQNPRCNPLCGWTALVRKSLWTELGGADPDQLYGDWDFFYRCYAHGATAKYLPAPLVGYREHAANGSHQTDAADAMRRLHTKHPELNPVVFA